MARADVMPKTTLLALCREVAERRADLTAERVEVADLQANLDALSPSARSCVEFYLLGGTDAAREIATRLEAANPEPELQGEALAVVVRQAMEGATPTPTLLSDRHRRAAEEERRERHRAGLRNVARAFGWVLVGAAAWLGLIVLVEIVFGGRA